MPSFLDFNEDSQKSFLKLILKKVPTRELFDILRGKVKPLQVLAVLSIPIDQVRVDSKVRATRNLVYQLAHEEFFDRHQPKDLTFQSQLLCLWLKQPGPFMKVALLKNTLLHPKSSFEIRLLCSQLINKLPSIEDLVTPRIIDNIIKHPNSISNISSIKLFILQFRTDQKIHLLKALLPLLNDSNLDRRQARTAALGALIPSFSKSDQEELFKPLLPQLNDQNSDVRQSTACALITLLPSLSMLLFETLLLKLNDNSWQVRCAIASALGAQAPSLSQEEYIIKLFKALMLKLNDGIWYVRQAAIIALGSLGPSLSEEHKIELIKALEHPATNNHLDLRTARTDMLGTLAITLSKDKDKYKIELLQTILPQLNTLDEDVRKATATTSGALIASLSQEQQKIAVFKTILPLLKDASWCVRDGAATTFGTLAPSLSNEEHKIELFKALHPLLNDDSRRIRQATAAALGKLAPSLSQGHKMELLTLLLPLLNDENWHVREATATALGTLALSFTQEEHKIAVFKALLPLLNEPIPELPNDSWRVRQATAVSLDALIPSLSQEKDKIVLFKALLPLLKDPEWRVRQATAAALGRLIPSLCDELLRVLTALSSDNMIEIQSVQLIAQTVWVSRGLNQTQSVVEKTLRFVENSSAGDSSNTMDERHQEQKRLTIE